VTPYYRRSPEKIKAEGPNEVCLTNALQCQGECKIKGIVYNADKKSKYATDSHIFIRAWWSEFNVEDHRDRGDLRAETVRLSRQLPKS
jgi:hypothetical protein